MPLPPFAGFVSVYHAFRYLSAFFLRSAVLFFTGRRAGAAVPAAASALFPADGEERRDRDDQYHRA